MNDLTVDVTLVEVAPRDGLQNETRFIPTESKIALIDSLSETGLSIIETTSFVSEEKVPQMKDATAVFSKIKKRSGVNYPVLVPNQKGYALATKAGAKVLHVFTSASETFNQKNINSSVSESLKRFESIFDNAAKTGLSVRAYLSCCFGCPYEGDVPFEKTVSLALQLKKMGAYEVAIGDTLGLATPKQIKMLLKMLLTEINSTQIGLHLHNTYGQAIANIYASLDMGIRIFDSSIAGLGGCPYAKGATGNVATEDVIYLMHGLGLKTGVNLKALSQIGYDFCKQHHLKNQSCVGKMLNQS